MSLLILNYHRPGMYLNILNFKIRNLKMSYLSVVNFEQDHFKSRADESGR